MIKWSVGAIGWKEEIKSVFIGGRSILMNVIH
jgi:hypothetical protein